jgi:glycosyltransferase involved in cell wall biosynthesis
MILITVFTPTYNRAHTLNDLYDSLCNQSQKGFEWLIIDDGSTDNTRDHIEKWIIENKLSIRYYYIANGGKMRAHNKAVKKCKTELFFCVDSDDMLTQNAIELIAKTWQSNSKNNISGIVGYKSFIPANQSRSDEFRTNDNLTKLRTLYQNGFKGETSLIFRTSILAENLFPEIPGEKFITEEYVYNIIDDKYYLITLKETLTLCRYLDDGYSKNTMELKKDNPKGWAMYHNQKLKYCINTKCLILNTLNYISHSFIAKNAHIISSSNKKFITLLLMPLGYLVAIRRKLLYKNLK